jgi:asparagine synthase (glutamine-hydrolysing)
MDRLLPPTIIRRQKQPYRAPDAKSFFHPAAPEYVSNLLSPENLLETGYFDPNRVAGLVKKCSRSPVLGFKDNMAVVSILSTLLLHDLFIKNFDKRTDDAVEQQRGMHGAYAHQA